MERMIKIAAAACAVGAWWTVQAPAQMPAGDAAGAAPALAADVERDLCEAVAEGARLLVENHLVPAGADAKSALLEALIRASEPSVVFLGEDELAARSRRLADREWDIGLTLVAAADSLPKVAAVRADSPAAAAGILPGELIEKVGGHEVSTGTALKLVRGWMLGRAAGRERE